MSRITEGGVAEKDGKLQVGDRILSVSNLRAFFIRGRTSREDNDDNFVFAYLTQINGTDMTNATHETAVAVLTGLERFVRIVAEREVTYPRNGSSTCPSPGPEKSPKLFGLPKPYTGLNIGNRPSYVGSRGSPVSPPKPAPRKFTPNTDIPPDSSTQQV